MKIVKFWEKTNRNRFGANSLIAKPNFHSLSQFTENMVAIQMDRVKVKYDKPIYLGFSILEISKWLMYDFLYDFLKPKFGAAVTAAYMDTDSFILEFCGVNPFEKLSREEIEDRFDTSNMSDDNVYGLPIVNKKVLGMMKDENSGRIMTEFVGLRSKMYAIKVEDGRVTKKSKGVQRSVLKKYNIDNYKDCLFNRKTYCDEMITFTSKKHTIFTSKINKITLNCDDDKRMIQSDGINTYAWGHKNINNITLNNIDDSIVPMDISYS